jgi:type 1 glutamine amidotransferase
MSHKRIWLTLGVAACLGGSLMCLAQGAGGKKKVLIYSQSFGFRHSVVTRPLTGELSHAEKILKQILTREGYEVFVSQDFNDLNGDQFKNYDAIIFYTSGNPAINRDNLMKWLKDGGAFVGIHAATDTYKDWPEYVKAIGGSFKTHKQQRKATLKVEAPEHPALRAVPQGWQIKDEFYLHDNLSRDNVKVLMSIDTEKTSKEDLEAMGMEPGGDYPLAWTNEVGKGKVFYTALGHREDVWTNETYQKHLLGGLAWALKRDK